jgi:DNA-binding NtrC family response regulator
MKLIYFAWIGETDLKSGAVKDKGRPGPIASVLTSTSWAFEKTVLLCNYIDDPRVDSYLAWLVELGINRHSIDLRISKLSSPINYREIYAAASHIVEAVSQQVGKDFHPAFHLNPGTGAMQSIWILLGKGRFLDAILIESSVEKGVAEADIPFDIQAEYIPAIKLRADDRLGQLIDALPEEAPEFDLIVHSSDVMKEVVTRARLVANRDVAVLIQGESGTGKEEFAKAIHNASRRNCNAYVAVNCGAIPEELVESALFGHKKGSFTGAINDHPGYFEDAHGGTLFLDEIGELPKNAQVKLLRVLQEGMIRRVGDSKDRAVNVRIIAATNRDLATEVSVDRFRFDLYHRLAVAIIKLPPLRDRKGDLKLLIDHMLEKVNDKLSEEIGYNRKKLSVNAAKALMEHPWPGNVRELYNTLIRICLWTPGKTIGPEDVINNLLPIIRTSSDDQLGEIFEDGFNLNVILEGVEKHYIERALNETRGHLGNTHKLLGLNSSEALSYRMKCLGITNPFKQKIQKDIGQDS